MARARKVNREEQVAQAVLAIAARTGYSGITSENVARQAKVKEADLHGFSDPVDFMGAVFSYVDSVVADTGAGQEGSDISVHDRLFDVMMARFDVMAENRAGFLALMQGVRDNPCWAMRLFPVLYRSIGRLQHVAGAGNDPIRRVGLLVIYLAVLRVWQEDESTDMALTMAELDKRLSQAGRLEGYIPKKSA